LAARGYFPGVNFAFRVFVAGYPRLVKYANAARLLVRWPVDASRFLCEDVSR
jgi:hypothetical protein